LRRLLAREHFGVVHHLREFGDFSVSEVEYASGSRNPRHTNEQTILGFVIKGEYSKDVGRKNNLWLDAGSFFLIAADEIQADEFGPTTECLLVDCTPRFIKRLPSAQKRVVALANEESLLLRTQLLNELQRKDPYTGLLCESILLRAIGQAMRGPNTKYQPRFPLWLVRFRDALESHAHEELSIQRLAEQFGVHPVHLQQTFKRIFHCTPGEYVRRKRLGIAMRQLAQTNASVEAVAHASGFYDRSHLARTFFNAVGTSPAQYRALMRSREAKTEPSLRN
jgi:AraC family transcriptional regulator